VVVWVASYPRSGNNLTLLTLERAFGFKTAMSARPDRSLRKLGLPDDADLIATLTESRETVFAKTHTLPAERDERPAIYLIRDGRDAAVSHAHWAKARAMAQFADLDLEGVLDRSIRHGPNVELLAGQVPPGISWSDHVRAWTSRPGPTAIVPFESLIVDPVSVVRDGVQSLGIDVPKPRREIPSFDRLHRRNPVTYRRGEIGTWRQEMPPRLQRLFWRRHGATMRELGYNRD
jgi:hypothetical protein